MMRSLYSAISGLKNHQVKMDVIGNNIANVNTTGFKRSRVTFSTMLSQNMRGASTPSANQGGTNPAQIGLGSMLGSIDQIMTQGSSQTTGKDTDVMIQGPGFFVLDNGGQQAYSRAGAFSLDSNGDLVDPGSGALVQGYKFTSDADANTPTSLNLTKITMKLGQPSTAGGDQLTSYSIDQTGTVTGVFFNPVTKASLTHKIAQLATASFSNDAGLLSIGGNFFTQTNNSGAASIGAAGAQGRGTIVPSAVEMSNVDLSQEFTDMIVTQRGFQANSRVITVSDSLLQELIDLKRN